MLIMAAVFSSFLTLALCIPLTVLVMYKVRSTHPSSNREDFHVTEKNVYDLKDQPEKEDEVMNHTYEAVNMVASGKIKVAKNKAYAVSKVH